ncbi:S-4TM family putative pore-forming effector [Methanosaeta sp. UBA356]|jgi:hypothetical protein|uniref:S-4TM family putative pore-forming effector n=1 Tax=Methanosaeta sp. UBA356 TaxID=1915559 RepID=UPI00257D2B36|nr:S-4TM family putative pore-forming effector [Methanosaeta sp. UBA356]
MPNTITRNQNTVRQLERLAAQRYLYSKAKLISIVQIILAVPIVIVWSLAITFNPDLKVWAAFYGLSIAILDAAFIDRFIKSLKMQAAKIQELFDCDVLHLDWHTLKLNNKPDAESIEDLSKKLKSKDPELMTLKDWYPQVVESLPLHMARLICQRTNCWWDFNLRRRYCFWSGILLIVASILVFFIGLVGEMDMEKFVLAVLAPLSPAILLGIREHMQQHDAAERLDRLKSYVEEIWAKAIKNEIALEQIERESRAIQDAIFDCRSNNPLIYDRIYRYLRNAQDAQMNKGANELAEEYFGSLSRRNNG